MRGLADKNAIVTGGGGGIGTAISIRLAEEGCRVGVLDLRAEPAEKTAKRCDATAGQGHALVADITDHEAVRTAVADFETKVGPVDILVNNAGWDEMANFLDTEPAFWEKVIAINLTGALNLHHIVARGMAERGGGKIVNIASDAGRIGSSGEAVYSACKGGLISFSKALARELAKRHVHVNVVCPGPTDTPLFNSFATGEKGEKLKAALERGIPFRRLGQPDDLAGAVAFLASADADFITGQVLSVSGGLTMHG